MKNVLIRKAIIQTLIYSDLFDFPLTNKELWYLLKSNHKIAKADFANALRKLPSTISFRNSYYSLSSGSDIRIQRQEREKISIAKISFAKRAIGWLSLIQSIDFIGISGSVANGNAEKEDDIDIFLITKKNTVWLTRLFSLFVLQCLGIRRKRTGKNEENKLCLNMIIGEDSLSLPEERWDIYTAHEIAQLIPLYNRNNMYERFIRANSWVTKYMPNVLDISLSKHISNKYPVSFKKDILFHLEYLIMSLSLLETISRKVQMWLIKKHRTNETIGNSLLAFHPYDYRIKILSHYKKKLREYI